VSELFLFQYSAEPEDRHRFEAVAWIPTVVGLCVMLGIGGQHLASGPSYPAPSAASILSFAATVAGADLSWCTMTPDYGVYHDANASRYVSLGYFPTNYITYNSPSARIFTYSYLGIVLPSVSIFSGWHRTTIPLACFKNFQVILHLIGAAFAAAAPGVPSWAAGYDNGNDIGGLVSAVLEPTGRFGKCLVVLMALAISAPSAPIMYSFGASL
jgi:purine-cytosine permease-like protein